MGRKGPASGKKSLVMTVIALYDTLAIIHDSTPEGKLSGERGPAMIQAWPGGMLSQEKENVND
jgi:hypothetical protein